ncbi:MAG: hypothetical protein JWO31_311 [Phycisphaerales bacterium]|nr:hypothetical protein [Phycisphaerales bacterium]
MIRPTVSAVRRAVCAATVVVTCALAAASCRRGTPASAPSGPLPAGLTTRPATVAVAGHRRMPPNDAGPIPPLLSQTGTFDNLRALAPADSLLAYDVNVPFWSDGATKQRWVALPGGGGRPAKIRFAATGAWGFPVGTVFVKHFELPAGTGGPPHADRLGRGRRVETRLLVRDDAGGIYGASYRWRDDESDAGLVREGHVEALAEDGPDGRRQRPWYFPGPADCRVCHTAAAGYVLGINARQLNRDAPPPATVGGADRPTEHPFTENQLVAWDRLGLFEPRLPAAGLAGVPKLSPADDSAASLEARARSYLDANCAHCHRPGGSPGSFDARFEAPLAAQNLVGGPVMIDLGVDRARVIAPNDEWRSTLLTRLTTLEQPKMPPLGHEVLDARGAALVREWVRSLPGPAVLAPPTIDPPGGTFPGTVRVRLSHDDPAAVLRYTLDGSVPTASAAVYQEPIDVGRPTTVRAKAFKPGATRSVTAQQTFIVAD